MITTGYDVHVRNMKMPSKILGERKSLRMSSEQSKKIHNVGILK